MKVEFPSKKARRWALAAVLTLVIGGGGAVFAQVEAGDRGIAPVGNSSDLIADNITIDVLADSPEAARTKGWQEAQRRGWAALYRQTHGGTAAPALSDSVLDSIVTAIVIQQEQIGLGRYRATLGVQFDRARAGQILGISGRVLRSPPLLVVPIVYENGVAQSFERRSEWQRAWAQFRTADSTIDYVRTGGFGADTLLLNPGQQRRRSRGWWRDILNQYGASDVIFPTVRIERSWPGGPVIGYFSARSGPDNMLLGSFALQVRSPAGLRRLMQDGARRMDALFTAALADGRLRTDPSLIIEAPVAAEEIEMTEEALPEEAVEGATPTDQSPVATPQASGDFSIQIETPDSLGVIAAENALRSVGGVESANASSIAVGGVSVIRVRFRGSAADLRAALSSAGYRVAQSGNNFRISR